MKKILVGILLFASLGGIAGLFALKVEGVQTARHENAPQTAIGISANGLVEGTRPESALRTEVTGILLAVYVRENQDVKKGSLLAELHNEIQLHQVALAQAELDLARAQRDRLSNGEQSEKRRSMAALEAAKQAMYDQFKLEAERSTKLANQGAASREQAERDQFKLRQASADLEQARADRALVEAPARVDEMAAARARVAAAESRLRLAEAELAKTRLRAPSNGRILQLFAEPGETAGPTSPQPVLLLADLSKHCRRQRGART